LKFSLSFTASVISGQRSKLLRKSKFPTSAPVFPSYNLIYIDEAMTSDKTYDFSMVAGEFVEVYSKQPDQWDCIVTCFFLDTAHNVMEYLECISKILKKGGLWVNIGPLLYHYSE
jgi:hypothetical protein